MKKTTVFIATSLDGFIAREDGSIDWLPAGDGGGQEDYGYQALFSSIDVLVMGRNTFELVLSFGTWPYEDKPVIVLTTQKIDIPAELMKTVISMSGSPEVIIKKLNGLGHEHLYIDGGKTIQGFLRAGLIDELIVTRIPVLIGSGIPLFGPLPKDIHLKHIQTQAYENGIVQNRYEVRKGKDEK